MSPPISRSAPVDADLSPVRERAEAVLRELVGRGDARLRDDQWSAIRALVVDRRRALVVQRTGWGKSAVYFVATVLLREGRAPAAAPDPPGAGPGPGPRSSSAAASTASAAASMDGPASGPTVIISPLLALMRDQVAAARRAGINAVTMNSANAAQWPDIEARVREGAVDVLLVSPERLNNPAFREEVLPALAADAGLIVIDEAHCITTSAPTTGASAPCWRACPRARRSWPPRRPPMPASPRTSPSSSPVPRRGAGPSGSSS